MIHFCHNHAKQRWGLGCIICKVGHVLYHLVECLRIVAFPPFDDWIHTSIVNSFPPAFETIVGTILFIQWL